MDAAGQAPRSLPEPASDLPRGLRSALAGIGSRARNAFRRRPWYWGGSVAVILLVHFGSDWLDEGENLIAARYTLYRVALSCLPWKLYARETTIVLIDDDTYWKGEPAGRVPLKRRFLADLVTRIAKYKPAVIAIDVDLRSEDPTGRQLASAHQGSLKLPVAQEYADETADLLEAIRASSRECKIVLAKTLDRDESYVTRADVYDGFDFKLPERGRSRVSWGYVILPTDLRYIPRILRLEDGTPMDSFALAAARARYARALEGKNWEKIRLGLFLAPDSMVSLTASTLLDPKTDPSDLSEKLEHQIVLIGGNWSRFGPNQGNRVDCYPTPFGTLPGAFIHANYMETLLGHRTSIPVAAVAVVDLLAGALFAWLLGMEFRPLTNAAILLGAVLVSFGITIELLLHFGIFCDLILINIGLFFHWLLEPHVESMFGLHSHRAGMQTHGT
jgi:CHASE2 domain-containing sensor protein